MRGSLGMVTCAIAMAIATAGLTCVRQGAFRCGEDADCVLNGVSGRCELIGFCSFPDPSCASGSRFGAQSGDQAGVCVDPGDIVPELVTVGGSVDGLEGTGLVLRNNGADDLAVQTSGAFSFPTRVLTGDPYEVTVGAQPTSPSQTCSVLAGSGVAGVVNVTDVTVVCATTTYTVGGTVTGLVGAGLVLTNNATDDEAVTSNGAFTFETPIASGAGFAVAIKTQPSGQTCNVSGATGTIGAGNVTSVVVNCTPNTFTIGGTISGLEGTVVLHNGSDDQPVTSNGSFAFQTPLAPATSYAVSVQTQPGFPPRSQTCVVTAGSGTVNNANVTSVVVTCTTNTFAIGGSISGLSGSIVLRNNGVDEITRNASGPFSFPMRIASGGAYNVSIETQPANQTCTISMTAGTATTADITNIVIDCGAGSGDPGILCGGSLYCDPAAGERCCVDNGTPSCTTSCNGAGTLEIRCDTQADCAAAGTPQLVCCGTTNGTVVNSVFCGKQTLCMPPDAFFCDPDVADPCPNGGTCMPTDVPFPGYFRCF